MEMKEESAKARKVGVLRGCKAAIGVAVLVAPILLGAGPANAAYVGSDNCMTCHEEQYNHFRVSGHPFKLRPATEAKTNPLPLPSGLTWDDISYVIGGYKWKVRYMDKNGYIVTSPGGIDGKNQYNLATGQWVDYNAGQQKPYDCGKCHTTGYSPQGNQDGLPGIKGTWTFPGIQCEACHGEGSTHVTNPTKTNIVKDSSAEACGTCHTRENAATIPAAGGFIRHQEQYNEHLQSPHRSLNCVTCHNPHKKAEFSIDMQCTDCHTGYADPKVAFTVIGRKMANMGVTCMDCHMPYVMKSAVAFNLYKADVRSHLFRINTDQGATFLNEAGNQANGYITPDYACLGCHIANTQSLGGAKAKKWAEKNARKIHRRIR